MWPQPGKRPDWFRELRLISAIANLSRSPAWTVHGALVASPSPPFLGSFPCRTCWAMCRPDWLRHVQLSRLASYGRVKCDQKSVHETYLITLSTNVDNLLPKRHILTPYHFHKQDWAGSWYTRGTILFSPVRSAGENRIVPDNCLIAICGFSSDDSIDYKV